MKNRCTGQATVRTRLDDSPDATGKMGRNKTLEKRKGHGMGHILICSVGRAGTSFMVQLLGELGMDTGYPTLADARRKLDPIAHAGLEYHGKTPPPRIVKSTHIGGSEKTPPWFDAMEFDAALLCVRDLRASAESRRRVEALNAGKDTTRGVPGGLVGTDKPEEQERVLLERQWRLMEALARKRCEVILLQFPRLATEAGYLRGRLMDAFGHGEKALGMVRFAEAFARVAREGWVQAK